MSNSHKISRKVFIFSALSLILIICFLLWHNLSAGNPKIITSDNGVWDLKEIDISNESVRLIGAVEYIPFELLTPEEFEQRQEEAVLIQHSTSDQCMTTRLRLAVPDGWYTFTRVSIDFSQRLYVNGSLIAEIGSPGETAENDIPNTGQIIFTAQPIDGIIELVQQSSNYVHRDGTSYADWIVGGAAVGRTVLGAGYAVSIEMGLYLCLFLIFLLLYCTMHRYRTSLYFSLLSLMGLIRTGLTGSKIFTVLLPWMNWYVKFRLEYLSFPISMILFMLIIHGLFPEILQKQFMGFIIGFSSIFALLFLFLNTFAMSRIMPLCQGIYIIAFFYILTRFLLKLRKANLAQGIFLSGIALFFYSMVRDVLYYNNLPILPPYVDKELSPISALMLMLFEAAAAFLAAMREMDEVKEMEQRLIAENTALEKMNQFKNELVETISHEARTPLAVLSSYAGLVSMELRQKGVDLQIAEDLDKIVYESQRVADLIDGMNKAVMGGSGEPDWTAIDLGALALQTARLYRPILERQSVALVLDIEENLPMVTGSPGQLSQVLFNLMQNAKTHTCQGQIKVSVTNEKYGVVLSVADTGGGIEETLLPHVLEQGIHGSEKGSGLGLYVCSEIIKNHGGNITIESKSHQGTKVTVILPAGKENL